MSFFSDAFEKVFSGRTDAKGHRGASSRKRTRRLTFENLESRAMFSALAPGYSLGAGGAIYHGSVLAYSGTQAVMQMIKVNGGVDTLFSGGGVYFSPDGKNLGGGGKTVSAYGGTQTVMQMVAANGGVDTLFSGGGVYFSPDGKNLGGGGKTVSAYGGTQTVMQMVAANGGVDTLFSGGGVYFSPDGKKLGGGGKTVSAYGGTQTVMQMVAAGSGVDTLFSDGDVYFSPDGKKLGGGGKTVSAYGGTQTVMQMVAAGSGVDTFFSGGGVYFSPNGQNLGGGGNTAFIASNVQSHSVAPNGTLYVLGTSGLLQSQLPGQSGMTTVATGVTKFIIAPANSQYVGDVFSLGADGSLKVTGALKWSGTADFAFGPDGTLYWLGTGGLLQSQSPVQSGWTTVATGVTKFTIAPANSRYAGDVFSLGTDGSLKVNGTLNWSGTADFAFGPDGTLYWLGAGAWAGLLQSQSPTQSGWTNVATGVTKFTIAPANSRYAGDVFSLGTDGSLRVNGTLNWSGTADFAFGPDGTLYWLGAGTWAGLLQSQSPTQSGWTDLTGTNTDVVSIAVAGNSLYMLGTNGAANDTVWQYTGTPDIWTALTGTNTSVVSMASAGSSLYMMASNNGGVETVWQYTGTPGNWTALTGSNTSVASIAVASSSVYMMASNNGGVGTVWQYTGTPGDWTALTGSNTSVASIAVAGGSLYMMASNNGGVETVWQYTGTPGNWTALTGSNTSVASIAVASSSVYMMASNNGGVETVWQYTGTPGNWTALTGSNTSVASIAVAGSSLYMRANNNGGAEILWQYTGTPGVWNEIASGVQSFAVDDDNVYFLANGNLYENTVSGNLQISWSNSTAINLLPGTASLGANTYVYFVNGMGENGVADGFDSLAATLSAVGVHTHVCDWDDYNTDQGQGLFGIGGAISTDAQLVATLTSVINSLPSTDHVILIGHSYGGESVLDVANHTSHPIDVVATLDPVGPDGFRSKEAEAAVVGGSIVGGVVGGAIGGLAGLLGGALGILSADNIDTVPSNVKYFYNRWQQEGAFPVDFATSGYIHSSASGSLQTSFGITDQQEVTVPGNLLGGYHMAVPNDAQIRANLLNAVLDETLFSNS